MKRKSSLTVAFLGLIAVLLGHVGPLVAADAVLEIEGTCPGQVRISWSEALPDRRGGLVFGELKGTFVIPSGFPCSGMALGVARRVRWLRTVQSDSNGSGIATGHANPSACGGFLQLVFSTPQWPCQLSNVVQIPQ